MGGAFELDSDYVPVKEYVERWRVRVDALGASHVWINLTRHFPFKLPDVFVEDLGIYGRLPHIDHRGKVCYCDEATASVSVDQPAEVMLWVMEKVLEALNIDEHVVDPDAFASEFDHYWTGSEPFLSLLEDVETLREVDVLLLDSKVSSPYVFMVHEDMKVALRWLKQSGLGRSTFRTTALLLPGVVSPLPPYPATMADIRDRLKAVGGAPLRRWERYLSQSKTAAIVLSTMASHRGVALFGWSHPRIPIRDQPKGVSKLHGAVKGFRQGKAPAALEIAQNWGNDSPVSRYSAESITLKRLVSRTSGESAGDGYSHIVVVGLGSLGGHTIAQLVASHQFKRATLIDPDTLKIENMLRHAAGFDYVGLKKVEALARILGTKAPWMQIDALDRNVLHLITEFRGLSETADVVVLATGNDALESFLLDECFNHARDGLLIHRIWVSANANEGHVVRYQVGAPGCHRCTTLLCAVASAGEVQYEPGCGAGFAVYGGSRLQRFTARVADKILMPPSGPWHFTWIARAEQNALLADSELVAALSKESECSCG